MTMTVQQLLAALSENESAAKKLAEDRKKILADLESAVPTGDVVAAAGYIARWKPGRRTTDHEAAAAAVTVDPAIVERHTTVKTSVAWAKVTKEARVPKPVLDQFTTEAPPEFSVEPQK